MSYLKVFLSKKLQFKSYQIKLILFSGVVALIRS